MEPIEWAGIAVIATAAYLIGKARRGPKKPAQPVKRRPAGGKG